MDKLCEEILSKGWTEARRAEFLGQHGNLIRRSILYNMRVYLGTIGLEAIGEALSRLQGNPVSHSSQGLSGDSLDLAVNTWQDVWIELYRPKDHLIQKYRDYSEASGSRALSFVEYLKRQVKLRFHENLLNMYDRVAPGLSQKEILDRIVDSKKESTRLSYIHSARELYANQVQTQLRTKFPQLRQMSNVIDYFFEVFIAQEYPDLRYQCANQPAGQMLNTLLTHFSEKDAQEAMSYQRRVHGVKHTFENIDEEDQLEDTSVQDIPVDDESKVYWDQLIRCGEPSPEQIEARLIRLRPDKETVLCWILAQEKQESRDEETKKNLLAFIVYFCSQSGPQRSGRPAFELRPETLSLEVIAGRYFNWEKDICAGIFKKTIKKQRIADQLRERVLSSRYGHLVTNPSSPSWRTK